MNIFLWILFGGLAGWLASLIAGRGAEMGVLANIVVGIAGAFRWLDCGPSRFWRKTGCRTPDVICELFHRGTWGHSFPISSQSYHLARYRKTIRQTLRACCTRGQA